MWKLRKIEPNDNDSDPLRPEATPRGDADAETRGGERRDESQSKDQRGRGGTHQTTAGSKERVSRGKVEVMRPRHALLAACPWLTREEASEALRGSGGDVEKAKRAAFAARRRAKVDGDGGEGRAAREPAIAAAAEARASSEKPARRPDDGAPRERAPPRRAAPVHNLSDRRYCCVWAVEAYEDGHRPDVARALLAAVARHVNPVLRARGWRVKRLIESASPSWIGLCTTNGRGDADAASTNIQLNLRARPDKRCARFRTFRQVLAVMLHEITHTSIGLEDIHPPAFWELLEEIKTEYRTKLAAGEVDLEKDDYGCDGQYISKSGELASVSASASDIFGASGDSGLDLLSAPGSEGGCGAKRGRRRRGGAGKRSRGRGHGKGYASNVPKKRPLLKGAKMIDQRTKAGKAAMAERKAATARELAAKAALARCGDARAGASSSAASKEVVAVDDGGDDDSEGSGASEEEEEVADHEEGCGCRFCDWSKRFSLDGGEGEGGHCAIVR